MEYKAHQVASQLGVTVPTLHYYEKAGLLPPIKRDKIKNRVYTEADIEWLFMIICMREIGLSIRDIKQYVELLLEGPETMSKRLEYVKEYKKNVEEKIILMQSSLKLLDAKTAFYQEMLTTSKELSCRDFSEEWDLFKSKQGGDLK
ncbi:MAG: MerR family transcriptional regulator [Coprobacillaceae bacterium]